MPQDQQRLVLSVNVMPEHPINEIVALAQQAEQLGFDRCWVYDEGLATRDVYVVLAGIALATHRMELGPGITNPYTRHPGVTAAAIASIDELSNGRAFLGVGAGGSLTLGPLGIERESPLTAVRELIASCRGLFSKQPTSRFGSTGSLVGAKLGFGRPALPIWLAGRGPKMLALGAHVADGVMLDFLHQDLLGPTITSVRNSAVEVGNTLRVCYSTLIVLEDDSLDMVRPHMTYRLVDSTKDVRERIGLSEFDRLAIKEAMSDGLEAAGNLVRDEWVLPFVISGRFDQCVDQLRSLGEHRGVDEFMLPVLDHANASAYLARVAPVLEAARS